MSPLDPIVSLAVAVAETPGSYAFLLGAGVSRDAGVPTGGEVFWRAVGDLYRVEQAVEEQASEEELGAWLQNTGRGHFGYSDVLEEIAPQPEERRAYLAGHFEGREPGPTHERLAELAARGLVRVLVTTNFDRLLEAALRARGIEPVLISQAADLEVLPPREHAACYLLKVHGDYLQQTIRNTRGELAELEPRMAADLQEVCDRFGIVALGYGGTDPAVTEALRRRRSRYGLYWVAREELGDEAATTVQATGGRVIERPSAADFLADLDRRVTVYEHHDSGQTPVAVWDEVILLLRRADRVGLRELLRAERRPLQDALGEVVADWQARQPREAAAEVHGRLRPLMERRLACLMALCRHDEELWREEVDALADLAEPLPAPSGYSFWTRLGAWPLWWMGHLLGAWAVREGAWSALGTLMGARRLDPIYGRPEPLVASITEETGETVGHALRPRAPNGGPYLAPAWQLLLEETPGLELIAGRAPELASGASLGRELARFSFLHCLRLGLWPAPAFAYWQMHSGQVESFARRLHGDTSLRRRVAEGAFGLSLEDFDADAAEALVRARSITPFAHDDAIRLLATGSA